MRIISTVAVWLFLVGSAEASLIFSLSPLGGGEVVVRPGENFNAGVSLNTTTHIYALSLRLESDVSDILELRNRVNWEPWVLEGTTTSPLNPRSVFVGWGLPEPGFFGPGSTTVGSVQLGVKATAPLGQYQVTITNGLGYPLRWTPSFIPATTNGSISVRVVPEPGLIWPVLASACFWRRRA